MVRSKIGQRILEGVLVLILLFVLAMAFLPFCIFSCGNTHEPIAGEAKAAIGTIKERMQSYYDEHGNSLLGFTLAPRTWAHLDARELEDVYYRENSYRVSIASAKTATIYAFGSVDTEAPDVTYTFDAATRKSAKGYVVTDPENSHLWTPPSYSRTEAVSVALLALALGVTLGLTAPLLWRRRRTEVVRSD